MQFIQMVALSGMVAQMAFVENRDSRLVPWGEGSIPIDLCVGDAIVYDGEIELLSSRLGDLQVASLTGKELMLLRNAIFARYGLAFEDDSIGNYFHAFPWYSPERDDVSHLLNETDLWNLQLIQFYESMLEPSIPEMPDEHEFAGFWHGGRVDVANYSQRYILYPEGRFMYIKSGYDGADRLLQLTGEWHLDGRHLVLEADSAVYLQGGIIVEEPCMSYTSAFVIFDGEEMHLEISPAQTFRLPLDDYHPDWSEVRGDYICTMPFVRIGHCEYWNFAPDGVDMERFIPSRFK